MPTSATARITVERPKSDDTGHPLRNRKGLVADPHLRDNENVPLTRDIDDYMKREVLPHAADAWVDASKTKVGYEVPFTRHFYRYTPPRAVKEIDADLDVCEAKIQRVLREVAR